LSSEIISYQNSKATGIATQSLDNYRLYESKIDNMRLSNAIKLNNFWLDLQNDTKKEGSS
jgi:hypothetical protein